MNPSASGIFYHPKLVSDITKEKRFPSNNYLSWALNGASLDELVLTFVRKRVISGLRCE